ncbi:hypothetical protein BDV33DRAFT_207615 [Aspergillus novoparasiticus]|uniref:ABC transmembrane type-1 domain-containing protein n=1 Tax=Aspergillus novoparasiticus TaxID=986946 RepID=A0A5N6EHF2_9EURO|nr:hypothetical protein BDV33DRAFT_207615 [Aspergillus novoparasiticus]
MITISVLGISSVWKLGIVCLCCSSPLLLLSGYLRIRLEYKLEEDTAARFASSAAIATEANSAIRTVASLALENKMLQIYKERLDDVAVQAVWVLAFTVLWYPLAQSINFLVMELDFCIRENIAMPLVESTEATDRQIEQACKDANILDFILSLPDGLASDVSVRDSKYTKYPAQPLAVLDS